MIGNGHTIDGARRYDASAGESVYDPVYSAIPEAPFFWAFVLGNLMRCWE